MARIVNKSQQVTRRAISPRPYYTRVIGFYLSVPLDTLWHYATTPVLGNNIWLLRVTIRHLPRAPEVINRTLYEIVTGKSQAQTIDDLAFWEHVIPNAADGGNIITMSMWDGADEHTEEMKKFYAGKNRRFGIVAYRNGAGDDALQVTFEISEG